MKCPGYDNDAGSIRLPADKGGARLDLLRHGWSRRSRQRLGGPLQGRDERSPLMVLLLLANVGDVVGEALSVQREGPILLLPEKGRWVGWALLNRVDVLALTCPMNRASARLGGMETTRWI